MSKSLAEQRAVEIAIAALGVEVIYTNYYQCQRCDTNWIDQWSCACDDDCPSCGFTSSPIQYETNIDLDGDDNG